MSITPYNLSDVTTTLTDGNLTITNNTTYYTITLNAGVNVSFNEGGNDVTTPVTIILAGNSPTISNTTFTRQVNIDMVGFTTLNITNTNFLCDKTLDTINLNIYGTATKNININNIDLVYSGNGIPCLNIKPSSNEIKATLTHVIDDTSSLTINPDANISLTSLITPVDFISSFDLKLVAGDYLFTPINTNYTFTLLGDVFIYNSRFEDNCTFNTGINKLTFAGCTFSSKLTPTYLCTTVGDTSASVVSFVAIRDNFTYGVNLFYPSKVEQLESGGNAEHKQLWSNTNCTLDLLNIHIYMYLQEGDYLNFANLEYFNRATVVIRSSSEQYTFGSLTDKLTHNLNLKIDDSIDNPFDNDVIFTIYTESGSVNLNNQQSNIDVIFSGSTTIVASDGNPAIYSSGINHSITLNSGGTYTNNNNVIFDSQLIISYDQTETPAITANYATATARINLVNENIVLRNYNNLWLTGENLHLYIPTELDGLFEFKNTSGASLSGSDIRSRIKLTLDYDFTIDSSYVGNVSYNSSKFDLYGDSKFTLSNSVIDYPNPTDTIVLINTENSSYVNSHSLTGNTFNLNATSECNIKFYNLQYLSKDYFKDTNIFNLTYNNNKLWNSTADTDGVPLILSKSLKISTSVNCNVTCLFAAFDTNESFYIVSDKLVAVGGTNGNDIQESSTPNVTMTFTNINFNSGTTSLINYIDSANNNIILKFTNINFYTTSSVNSLTPVFNMNNNYDNTSTYKVYVIGSGEFKLGNDPLVVSSYALTMGNKVYFLDGNATNATLCNTSSTSSTSTDRLYPNRLTINVESGSTNVNLVVKAANGLDIIDTCSTVHNINLNTGTEINVTSSNAIKIKASTIHSLININDLTTTSTTSTAYSVILIEAATQSQAATTNRVLTIINGLTFESNVKHFITNQDTMLLNINSAPAQLSYVTHNMIYWPTLSTMERDLRPLSGAAVKYAEAWEFVYNYTTYPTILQNNYTDVTSNAGLFIDTSNTAANTNTQDWANKNLQYLQVYSADALSGISYFNITLNKDHTNTSTNHTGKIDYNSLLESEITDVDTDGNQLFSIGDGKQRSDSISLGWLDCVINFSVSELALMPFTNNVILKLKPYSDSGEIADSTWTNNAYKINQNQTITKGANTFSSVSNYLNNVNTNSVHVDIFTAYYSEVSKVRDAYMELTDIPFIVNNNDILSETTVSQTIKYNIASCDASDKMYLIRPLNITFMSGSIDRDEDHNDADYRPTESKYPFIKINTTSITSSPYKTIIYPNIDDVLTVYTDGKSQEAIVDLDTDSFAWIVKTVDVSVNINDYQEETDPTSYTPITFSFDILNQSPDLQLVGIPMKSINETISSLTANASNTTTFNLSNLGDAGNNIPIPSFIKDANSHYVLTTYIALYSRVLPDHPFAPVLDGYVEIYENDTLKQTNVTKPIGVVTLTKDNNGNGVDDADNNITAINTIFRYKMVVTIDDITDLAIGPDYNVRFKLYDNTTPNHVITNSLNVVINYFTIPLDVYLSTNDAIIVNNMSLVGDIYTIYNENGEGDDTNITKDFIIYVNFSAQISGYVSLDFTNTDAGNTIDMSGFMSSIKLVDQTDLSFLSLSSTSTTTAISNSTQIELRYRFSPPVIPGKFYIKVNKLALTNTDLDDWIISNTITPITLTYLETRRHTIGITIGKVLNTPILNAGPPREVIAGVDVTTGVKAIIYDVVDTTEAKENVKLIPDSFTYGGDILSTDVKVKPFNKYTQYYLAVDTSSLGFTYNGTSTISNSAITVNFTFKNADDALNETTVDDVELINVTTSGSVTSTSISNLLSKNPPTSITTGNSVLVFRRKLTALGALGEKVEQTYTKLNIYYSFSNVSGTNYAILDTTPKLLATIDYSSYGTSSQQFSELCIGNWRIVPSGDGAKLLFNRIESGNSPYSVTIPMNPTDISIDDFDSNDSTLLSLEKTPHDNVPT